WWVELPRVRCQRTARGSPSSPATTGHPSERTAERSPRRCSPRRHRSRRGCRRRPHRSFHRVLECPRKPRSLRLPRHGVFRVFGLRCPWLPLLFTSRSGLSPLSCPNTGWLNPLPEARYLLVTSGTRHPRVWDIKRCGAIRPATDARTTHARSHCEHFCSSTTPPTFGVAPVWSPDHKWHSVPVAGTGQK